MGKDKSGPKKLYRTSRFPKGPYFFQHGRVCCINFGPDAGKLCCIVNFIDSTRALVDGPKSLTGVARQSIPFKRLSLTPIKIKILPDAKSATLDKIYKTDGVLAKWANLPWAKKLDRQEKRRNLTDFDRFKVMILRKKRSKLINDELRELKRRAYCDKRYHSKVPAKKSEKEKHIEAYWEAKKKGEDPPEKPKSLQRKIDYHQAFLKKHPKKHGVFLLRSKIRSKKKSRARILARRKYQNDMKKKRAQSAKKRPKVERYADYKPTRKKKKKLPKDPKKKAAAKLQKKLTKRKEKIKRDKVKREKKKTIRKANRKKRNERKAAKGESKKPKKKSTKK